MASKPGVRGVDVGLLGGELGVDRWRRSRRAIGRGGFVGLGDRRSVTGSLRRWEQSVDRPQRSEIHGPGRGLVLWRVTAATCGHSLPTWPRACGFALHPRCRRERLLAEEPLAVLIGMLLDQQVTMEWAFGAPALLKQRLGGTPRRDGDRGNGPRRARGDLPRQRPRCIGSPASMAKRTHDLCQHLVEHYDGRAEAIWKGRQDRRRAVARVFQLPGFGKDKSRIFVGLLGKRLGVRPSGGSSSPPTGRRSPTSTRSSASARSANAKRAMKAKKIASGTKA